MDASAGAPHRPCVDDYVEGFESALAGGAPAEVGDFAPPPDQPGRLAILCELVRVDLEHRWARGRPRRLEHYRDRFPDLFADPSLVRAMAFEEYRLRAQAGEAPTPDDYRARFGLEDVWPGGAPGGPGPRPESAGPSEGMEHAAGVYRAYRGRGAGGAAELSRLFEAGGVPGEPAEFLRELDRTDPHAAERLAEAVAGLPKVGSRFLGFRLCGELGRGAFGRVYLARQGDLADRLVALKVSADVARETDALAQLQHTNVVPVYSVHRRGPLQAVCMPYLGATTLADTLSALRGQDRLPRSGEALLSTLRTRRPETPGAPGDGTTDGQGPPPAAPPTPAEAPASSPQAELLRGLGYVPAVLWLVSRVADGLAHAHDRGILHRDLKPANILFSDGGEPLLLDFNLAADVKVRVRASAALVGGTLPYMAPEALRAFDRDEVAADARGDLYALGVVLYELLTGARPFPVRRGGVDDVLPVMIADRLGPPPDPRQVNPAVSPATASIVRRCLEPDPARRYQSARELAEDLRLQLDHRPLRHAADPSPRERLGKWTRRHPRLTSLTTVGVVAAALLLASGATFATLHRRYQRAEASASLRRLADERREALVTLSDPDADPDVIASGLNVCRAALGRYHALDDPAWASRPAAASLPTADRAALREGIGELLLLGGRALAWRGGPSARAEAAAWLDRAEGCYGPAAPRALFLARADLARHSGAGDAAVGRLMGRAEATPLRTPREALLALAGRVGPEDRRRLAALFESAEGSGFDGTDYAGWMLLGGLDARLARPDEAIHGYGVAVRLAPRQPWPRFNRGVAYLETKDYPRAAADFDRVLSLRPGWPPALLNRALARLGAGDPAGAVADLDRYLGTPGARSRAWFIRSRARALLGDRDGARRDRDEGLRRTPDDEASYVARGLARLPADPRGALADFDAALAINPRYLHALLDKASVLSEVLGRPAEALPVLDAAVLHHPASAPALAGRGVLRARLGRREAAVRDARSALDVDARPLTVYQAACVHALASRQEPADRAEALRLLAEALRGDAALRRTARTDPDLGPVRDAPGFRELTRDPDPNPNPGPPGKKL